MRRFVTLALSLSLVLGLSAAGRMFAQDVEKTEDKAAAPATDALKQKVDTPATETKEAASPAADTPKADAPAPDTKEATKAAATPAADAPLPSIPPEVEAKLEAARKAVAEAIVAAQDAGLVETSIDPPPILDILITGRATDANWLVLPCVNSRRNWPIVPPSLSTMPGYIARCRRQKNAIALCSSARQMRCVCLLPRPHLPCR